MNFENRYIRTPDDIKEALKYQFFGRTLMRVFYAVMVAFWVSYIVLSAVSTGFSFMEIFVIAFVPVFFAYFFFIYRRTIKIHNARETEMLGGKPLEVVFTANDEGIRVTSSGGTEVALFYSQIKMVARTKNLIIVVTKSNLMYILRNDSFTIGDEEGFLRFMLENRVKVK